MREIQKAETFANLILGGGVLWSILLLFYAFYDYGWTGTKQFATPAGIIAYYIVPATVAVLFCGFFRFSRDYKINLAVLSLSTALSIYGAELFLALSKSNETEATAKLARQFGVDFDTREPLAVVHDFRQRGVEAVPYVIPRGLLIDGTDASIRSVIRINETEVLPLAGISNKVTIMCNENGAYTIYDSDEHGFHNPAGIWRRDHIDIAAIGDSFTHGACVPSDRNFVSLIRQHFPATLNLGIGGNGPLLELASLKEYLPHVKPQLVLWFYFERNDLSELKREAKSSLLMSYMKGDFKQGLVGRQSEIDKVLREYVQEQELIEIKRREAARQRNTLLDPRAIGAIIKLSALREKIGLVYGRDDQDVDSSVGVVELDMFRSILVEAKAAVEAWNGQLYFVYLPQWARYSRPQLVSKNRDAVLRLVKDLDIPAIDIHPAFQVADPLSLFPFRQFGHYNEKGHRLVAETVLQSLSVKSRLPQSDSGP
jgi:hypothetical protein